MIGLLVYIVGLFVYYCNTVYLDLRVYECDHSPHIDVAQVNPRSLSVTARHVLTKTAHFEQFC